VQLTSDEAGGDIDVVAARLERVEHQLKELRESGGGAAAAMAPRDPTTGRAVLGGAARRSNAPAPAPAPASAPAPAASSSNRTPASQPAAEPPAAEPAPPPPIAHSVPEAWRDTVKSQLKPLVRALYSAGEFTTEVDGVWQFSVPNEAHGAKCAEHQAVVEAALSAAVGAPVSIAFIAGGSTVSTQRPERSAAPAQRPAAEPSTKADQPRESAIERATRAAATEPEPDPEPAPYVPDDDDEIDLSELTDAPPEAVKTPIERLADAFPGSELIADDRD